MFRGCLALACAAAPLAAQPVESAGSRALGMGGAFVAVANDSSATWWNPAGLATGPFLDLALGFTDTAADDTVPGHRMGLWSFAFGIPPLGVSYYRFEITDIAALDSTAPEAADRQDRRAGVGIRSLSASQVGASILHTLFTGVHVGATVKYVRGTARRAVLAGTEAALPIPELLDQAGDLEGGEAQGYVDLDVGALAALGPFRAGAVVRNVGERRFETGDGDSLVLPRQVRIGAAFDGEAAGALPLILSVDVDAVDYTVGASERQVIAAGAEYWLRPRRIAVRGGARFNTTGAHDEAVTAGATLSPRAGVLVDGFVVLGSRAGEDGWGVAARVSF